MVSNLTNEHYKTIHRFSQKISNGVNADDLSQHVILSILQKDKQFINGLIERGEFNFFIWKFISNTFNRSNSKFNRELYNSFNVNEVYCKPNNVDIDLVRLEVEETETIQDLTELIAGAGLTDLERMYINAYKDNFCSYKECSRGLDIHPRTISKHVKRAIEKCKKSL